MRMSAIFWRALASGWRGGAWWLPTAFFLLVATLYPFAVGPDAQLLGRSGGGIAWVAALLAALLPVERLFAGDVESGVLDQLVIAQVSEEAYAAATFGAHLLGFALPLLIALLPAAALLGLSGDTLARLALGLAIGCPALAALGIMVAAMTVGQRRSGALAGLLMLPLAVPVLIFGAGMLDPLARGALPLLGAASLLLVAIAPFAAGAALRGVRER
jgi:heme exporter protein B